jgi:pilus assembly protein CpaB
MKPSRIVLLLVAILAGGLAAFLATRNSPPSQVVTAPEVIQEAKTRVLVATAPIGVGQRLSPDTVAWQDWPEGAVRPEYINIVNEPTALEDMTDTVARFEIFPGDPILTNKIVRSEQGYLSAVLEKGKRGISIAVSADSASGGFIVPNDHVDVILTRAGILGQVSETILRNVKVLAIGNRLGELGSTGAPADPENPRTEVFSDQAIATLELDPVQGETVINASKIGTLSLALRSIADFQIDPNEANQPSNSQAVRVIRFGSETSVMAGNSITTGSIEEGGGTPVPEMAPAPVSDIPIDPATGQPYTIAPTE